MAADTKAYVSLLSQAVIVVAQFSPRRWIDGIISCDDDFIKRQDMSRKATERTPHLNPAERMNNLY